MRLICPDPCATFKGPVLLSQSSGDSAVPIDFFSVISESLRHDGRLHVQALVNKRENLSKPRVFSCESRACLNLLPFEVQAPWAQAGNNKTLLVIASVISRRASGRPPDHVFFKQAKPQQDSYKAI